MIQIRLCPQCAAKIRTHFINNVRNIRGLYWLASLSRPSLQICTVYTTRYTEHKEKAEGWCGPHGNMWISNMCNIKQLGYCLLWWCLQHWAVRGSPTSLVWGFGWNLYTASKITTVPFWCLITTCQHRNKTRQRKRAKSGGKRQIWLIEKAGSEEVKVQMWSSKENGDKARICCCCCWKKTGFSSTKLKAMQVTWKVTLPCKGLPVLLVLVMKSDSSATDRKANGENVR